MNRLLFLLLSSALLFSACSMKEDKTPVPSDISEEGLQVEDVLEETEFSSTAEELTELALNMLRSVSSGGPAGLPAYLSDSATVFSIDGHLDEGSAYTLDDPSYTAAELQVLVDTEAPVVWGNLYSGDPYEGTLNDYLADYWLEANYLEEGEVHYTLGAPEARPGGHLYNGDAFFGEETHVVEFHKPGTEEFGGLDWQSMKFIFIEQEEGFNWAAVVHDFWTP